MKPTKVLLWVPILCISSAGCERLGAGLDIVNETDRALYNVEVIPPDGGRWRYTISDCSDADLTVTTEDDTVFAVLTGEWCPGQTWTITGEDESTLTE